MRKALKIYRWAWVVLIVATIITVVVMAIRTSHHDLAKDPNNIEKIVKADLPDIAFVESENNLDRSASRWDIFAHRGKFICELTEETTTTLDNLCQTDSLHWRKARDRSVYSYYDYITLNVPPVALSIVPLQKRSLSVRQSYDYF